MKQHFITITGYQTKNKAHAEVQAFAWEYNNCLADDHNLYVLFDALEKKIREINEKYPRCKPIDWKLSSHTKDSQRVEVESNFYMHITEVKRFELTGICAHHQTCCYPIEDKTTCQPSKACFVSEQKGATK